MKLEDLVKDLQQYLSILNIKQMNELDGDALSRLAPKLASMNATLGGYVAQAERDADLADFHYDIAREEAYRDARLDKKTVADADNIKRMAHQEKREQAINLKYNHRVLQLLRKDVENLVDQLRSRLSYLKFRDDL